MKKICALCGNQFQTILHGGKRKYCFECSPTGSSRASIITNLRRKSKEIGVQKLGGRCKKCGEDRIYVLDFHHRDPNEKESQLSDFSKGYDFEGFFEELKKCDLLCANCHRAFHYLNREYNLSYENFILQSVQI